MIFIIIDKLNINYLPIQISNTMAITQRQCVFSICFTDLPLFESKIATEPYKLPEATYLNGYSF